MKVNQSGSNPIAAGDVAYERQTEGPSKHRSIEKSTSPHATSQISTKSKEFAKAKATALSAPDVREERVHDLKRRIAEGSYDVGSEAVADRLVDEHLHIKDFN